MKEDDDGAEISDKLGVKLEKVKESMRNYDGSGEYPDELKFLDKYFPEKEDMGQKTFYDERSMPVNISSLRILADLFPELKEDDYDEYLDAWIDKLEKRLISIQGRSRGEYEHILESLLTGLKEHGERDRGISQSMMQKLFTADKGGD